MQPIRSSPPKVVNVLSTEPPDVGEWVQLGDVLPQVILNCAKSYLESLQGKGGGAK